jgi:hypothetical protein
MRILSLVCILLVGCLKNVSGQITLVASDYPTTIVGVDSLRKTVYNSPFPALNTGADINWDMSVMVDTTPIFFKSFVASSGYHYADSSYHKFISYDFQSKNQYSISTSASLEHGRVILGEKYDLFSLTSGPTDSFFIPDQTDVYTSPRKVISFPCTYLSTWNSQYTSTFNFELSIAGYTSLHQPAVRRTYVEEHSSVTGYGKMRIKDVTGSPTAYFPVLQVQTITTTIDSFLLSGAPMPTPILGLFMLTQGHKDTIRQQNYYRVGEVTPLAKVDFRDDAFTQPYKATTHMQRLLPIGVDMPVSAEAIKVFPNPASHMLSVDIPGNVTGCGLGILDVNGKAILTTMLGSGQRTIEIPATIPCGHYYLKFINDTGIICTRPIDIIR